MEAGKRINDAIAERPKQPPSTRNATFTEKSSVKASSTGDIEKNFESPSPDSLEKCRSEGSSRNDSLENVSVEYEVKGTNNASTPKEPSREGDPRQRSRDRRGSGSAVNISVITSTPHRSKSVSRSGSGDNIVVITGKLIIKILSFSLNLI